MRNRTRFILALGALGAFSCAPNVAELTGTVAAPLISASALAQDDDIDVDEEFEAEEESDDFGSSDAKGEVDPFAPSKIPGFAPEDKAASAKKNDAAKNAPKEEEEPLDEEAAKKAKERAKYNRPEDVPDELKTEEDYFATTTAPERAILSQQPQNAVEWFRAAAQVARVGRPNFAKILVEKALQAPDGTPEESAKILDELGMGRSFVLVANADIGELGSQAYDKVFNVAKKYWENKETIRAALKQFADGSITDRATAIANVRKGGVLALSMVVDDLIGANSKASEVARQAIPFFESDGIEALIALMPNVSGDALKAVAGALGDAKDQRAGLELAARYYADADVESRDALIAALGNQFKTLPSPEEIAREVYQKAVGFYKRSEVFPLVVEDEVARWRWDADAKTLVQESVPLESAYREEAARLANAALAVAQRSELSLAGVEELAIAATAERDLYAAGLDSVDAALKTFDATFANVSADALQKAIVCALDARRPKGAILPCALLQTKGDESCCYSKNGEQSVIVRAATAPDRRLRFAALQTIVAWNPSRSYVGSSRVAEALQWFASSTGARVAVLASPHLEEMSKVGQYFAQQGFKTTPVTTGRDALLAAQSSADVEFVFATAPVSQPNISLVAQTLRGDVRTCDVPLLVGSGDEREATAANVSAGMEPNVYISPTPFDLESASIAVQNLFDVVKPEQVSAELRLQESKWAAQAILNFYQTRPELYEFDRMNDMIRRFLSSNAMFDVGLAYASFVKTNYAQNALIGAIGDARFDEPTRRKALRAFEAQLQRNGSLLRGPEIKKMYDRYNASEKEDAAMQSVLSDMLDVYEKATKK